jgi:hypothetical protein
MVSIANKNLYAIAYNVEFHNNDIFKGKLNGLTQMVFRNHTITVEYYYFLYLLERALHLTFNTALLFCHID